MTRTRTLLVHSTQSYFPPVTCCETDTKPLMMKAAHESVRMSSNAPHEQRTH